jgi:hypothetical protein
VALGRADRAVPGGSDRPLAREEEKRLGKLLAGRFGHAFTVRWLRVEAIARGAGGKYEDFISRVA